MRFFRALAEDFDCMSTNERVQFIFTMLGIFALCIAALWL
jgi:hypothetical protein